MTITDLVRKLEDIKRDHGNLPVVVYTGRDSLDWADASVEEIDDGDIIEPNTNLRVGERVVQISI